MLWWPTALILLASTTTGDFTNALLPRYVEGRQYTITWPVVSARVYELFTVNIAHIVSVKTFGDLPDWPAVEENPNCTHNAATSTWKLTCPGRKDPGQALFTPGNDMVTQIESDSIFIVFRFMIVYGSASYGNFNTNSSYDPGLSDELSRSLTFVTKEKGDAVDAVIVSAAGAAQVTGDPEYLLYSALAESAPPAWFTAATDTMDATTLRFLEGISSFIEGMSTSDRSALLTDSAYPLANQPKTFTPSKAVSTTVGKSPSNAISVPTGGASTTAQSTSTSELAAAPSDTAKSASSKLKTGPIVGIAISIPVVVIIVIIAGVCIRKRKQRSVQATTSTTTAPELEAREKPELEGGRGVHAQELYGYSAPVDTGAEIPGGQRVTNMEDKMKGVGEEAVKIYTSTPVTRKAVPSRNSGPQGRSHGGEFLDHY